MSLAAGSSIRQSITGRAYREVSLTGKRTIIVGGGGFARELLSWAADCADAGTLAPVAGVIDDNADAFADYPGLAAVIGPVAGYRPEPGDALLLGIGNPETKRRLVEQLSACGATFAKLVHPTAVLARTARVDDGAILCPLSLVSAHGNVGRFVTVNALSSVGHDAKVGTFSTLSAHVDLTGFVQLGESVMVGTGAKVVPGVRVGDGAVIGAGATVYRNVPAGATVYSAPAKLLKAR